MLISQHDKDRDKKLSDKELRESLTILGRRVSEDELMAKWGKKLGRKADNVTSSEFHFLVSDEMGGPKGQNAIQEVTDKMRAYQKSFTVEIQEELKKMTQLFNR